MANINFQTALLVGKKTEYQVYRYYNKDYNTIHQEEEEHYPIPDNFKKRKGYKLHKTPDMYFEKIQAYFDVKNSKKLFKRVDLEWYYYMGLDSGLPVYIITRGELGWEVLDVMYLCENILPDIEWKPADPDIRMKSPYFLLEDYPHIAELFTPFDELFT